MKLARLSLISLTGLLLPLLCLAQSHPIAAKAPAPVIASGGVVSAGAFGAFTTVAPGSWIEIYGSDLARNTRSWASTDFDGMNAPTSLDGTSVTIGGRPAFVDYVSPTQVNAQVPSNVGTGPQPVIVIAGKVASNPYMITVNAEQPGLLAPSTFQMSGQQYVGALFSDGVTYVLPPGVIAGVPSRRAQPGDNITLYGVGFGPVIPDIPAGQTVGKYNALALPFQLNFGQAQANVTYAGLAPGAAGLYQFNVTVPKLAASDAVPLTFRLGGASGTQKLYISVQDADTAPQIQSLTLSAASVTGGGTVQGTVLLSEPAPAGGAVVALSSNSSAVAVPATVTVPASDTSANCTISTSAVAANQTATITATSSGSSTEAILTVTQASGALPQFNSITIAVDKNGTTEYGQLGIEGIEVLGPSPDGGYTDASLAGTLLQTDGTTILGAYRAKWNNVTVSGQSLTFDGLEVSESVIGDDKGTIAEITSGSLTVTLMPQAANTSGTVTGSMTLVSTLQTITGSFTGTYQAQ